jgi:hypothetical protein
VSFAELFLRLGTALLAWMVLIAYFLWLAAVRVSGCSADDDALWRLLLAFAPLALLAALLVWLTRPLDEVHRILRWGWVPVALLVPLALASVWPTLERAALAGLEICGDGTAPVWQVWWAPAQLTVMVVVGVLLRRAWRRP